MSAEIDQLVWHVGGPLCTELTGGGAAGAEWFDYAGDLVVVDGTVGWMTPELSGDAPFVHDVPVGVYPVYVGSRAYRNEDSVEYRATTLVMPIVEPERIVGAEWDEGYDDYMEIDNYACLWDERASRATLPHWAFNGAEKSGFILNVERTILTEEALARKGNWFNGVADQQSGANVMAFPVPEEGITLTGFEARDAAGELTCLLLATVD
ncbi:hypothetical protein [Kutzneria sp. CA-103260]|uniref:hypothetical protein n=1 Tax=Kutzneria sp. CA-103260 TaxID=2802641 RepID=UPI001BA638D2|nr:hypothetical protein [Kutzneria sp. CA-103260]QUQ64356.1 hypothetical protein JJ691_20760 [Kutzneria sp. CA-103260]